MRAKRRAYRVGFPTAPGRLLLALVPVLAFLSGSASADARSAPGAPSACPTAAGSRGSIAKINERLEITLKDGRTLRLAGLEPPRPTPDQPDFDVEARDALRARAGNEIAFLPLGEMDRWGRIPAFVFFTEPGAAPASAGQFLLAGGFARFLPEPAAHSCRSSFLAAETAARDARLGLWRDPFYAILAPTDRSAFAERAATNVIVEGRLTGVDEGRLRIYLQFVPRRARAFEITILQRNVKKFAQAGMEFHDLVGRTLRVRGLLDLRFGPQIEIASPDEIELIPQAQNDRPF
jgi:endonuclease YncB( thermonuclease family)